MNLQRLFKEKIESIELIEKGFSVDRKVLINHKYLVRIVSLDRVERFQKVFEFQKKFHQVALCQKPLDFVIEETCGYFITEYIPGKNGLEVIQDFTKQKQRELGIVAGYELSKAHKKFVDTNFDVRGYLMTYSESKFQVCIEEQVIQDIPEINDMIETVRENLHHLFDLIGIQTHSDYHLFNMIFDEGEYKGVIDFERCRTGIFLTDFRNNTPHNSYVSPEFASGFIDGYLDEIPISDFFLKYNIHDLLIATAAVPWVKEFNPESLDDDIKKIREIYKQKDKLSQAPPWYVGRY